MIELYDTTLRDGAQTEGVSFSLEDKVRIAHLLDDFGIHFLEAGWPSSNPKAREFFDRLKKEKFSRIKIAAFGATRRAGATAAKDPNLQELVRVEPDAACIFGKSWDLHAEQVLRVSLDDNLRIILDSVAFLKKKGLQVIYDAEHFFDGFKANPKYAVRTLQAAADGGADRLTLCDTNGGSLPHEIEAVMNALPDGVKKIGLGIHAHNDGECAAANTLAAVRAGAVQVQGTINGLGERCGNANLVSVIPNLVLKMGIPCVPLENLKKLTAVSRRVSELLNQPHPRQQPFTGASAFAHKGGVHTHAVKRVARSYEHIDPEIVGARRRILLSEHSGSVNVAHVIEQMGISTDNQKGLTGELLRSVKEMEREGFQFEGAEGSFLILARKSMKTARRFFELEGFHVSISRRRGGEIVCEATIKMSVDGVEEHTAADGNGPVDALDRALRKALEKFYPCLREVTLTDYKVRVLEGGDGTAARVRVLIQSRDRESTWGTVGVSVNLIHASWRALVDSLEFKLYKELDKNGKGLVPEAKGRPNEKKTAKKNSKGKK